LRKIKFEAPACAKRSGEGGRNPKLETNAKIDVQDSHRQDEGCYFENLNFEFVSGFGIRVSDFCS